MSSSLGDTGSLDVGIGIGGGGVYTDVDGSDLKLPVPKFPVPMTGSFFEGVPVEPGVVTASVVVLLTVIEDEVESNGGRCNELNSDSQKEVVSLDDCRNSRFDELLEDEDEDDEDEDEDEDDDDDDDDDVEVAGAVVFVTIWRLICRGK